MRKQWESGGYDWGVMLVLRQPPRTQKVGAGPEGLAWTSRASVFLTWQRGRGETDHFPKDCFLRILFNSKQRESVNFFLKKRHTGVDQAPPSHGAGGSIGLTFLMPTVATSIGPTAAACVSNGLGLC